MEVTSYLSTGTPVMASGNTESDDLNQEDRLRKMENRYKERQDHSLFFGDLYLIENMQPSHQQKIYSADQKGHTRHHGITERRTKRDHKKPDANFGGAP